MTRKTNKPQEKKRKRTRANTIIPIFRISVFFTSGGILVQNMHTNKNGKEILSKQDMIYCIVGTAN